MAGTYVESCNCDPICPCRRIDGRPGGRSTYGICLGALSWLIEEGHLDGTDLSGLNVAIASSYSDDEPGSPWMLVAQAQLHPPYRPEIVRLCRAAPTAVRGDLLAAVCRG